MDTKKLVLAVILSIVVIVIYQYFFMPKPTKPVPRLATEVTSGEVQPERQPLLEEKKDQKPSDQDLSGSSIEDIFAKKEKKAEVIVKKSGPITQDLKDTRERPGCIPDALRQALPLSSLVLLGYNLYDWDFRVAFRGVIAKLEKVSDGGFRLSGDLNFDSVPALASGSQSIFSGEKKIDIDLVAVSRSDSAGVALLIEWQREAKRNKQQITFRNIPSNMLAISRLSGVDEMLSLS